MLKTWIPGETPEKEELKQQLDAARKKLYDLQMKIKEHKLPVLVLFEGWSAAGKGSMIGKVIKNIDPRFFKVATMSAPSEEELRRPFLYRYMCQIPEQGKFTFLDSGWMEQTTQEVLRKELTGEDYEKRIESIRRFERQLTDNGYLVLKFFMQIRNSAWINSVPVRIHAGECQNSTNGSRNITANARKSMTAISRIRMHQPLHGIS